MAATARGATVRAMVMALIASTSAFACSSVPDVQFVDAGDGAASSSSSGSVDSGADAGRDAAVDGATPPDWSCPTKPPPATEGVCCGNRLCLKCTQSDCTKCQQEGCGGTLTDVCCRKNPAQMQCKAYTDC